MEADMKTAKPANRVRGHLIYLASGNYAFRVYNKDYKFVDYDLLHSDLHVIIDDEDSALYQDSDRAYLDHSPATLGYADTLHKEAKGMKKFLYFMQWNCRRMSGWDIAWWVGFITLLASFAFKPPYDLALNLVAVIIFLAGFGKFVHDIYQMRFEQFEKEREEIITIIKEGK
jgi:hypothetical protein